MGIFRRMFGKRKHAKSDSNELLDNHLKKKLLKQEEELDQKGVELAKAEIEIDKFIQSLKPNSTENGYIPPFHTWMGLLDNQELNVEEALDQYINKFDLLRPETLQEPLVISKIAARLKVLRDSQGQFNPEVSEDLNRYIFRLQSSLMMHRTKWNMQKKMNDLDKKINDSDKNSKG